MEASKKVSLNCPIARNDLEIRAAITEFDSLILHDDPVNYEYTTHIDCVGEHATFVSRMRVDDNVPHTLNMLVVSDNLSKAAALNTVQIAEALIDRGNTCKVSRGYHQGD